MRILLSTLCLIALGVPAAYAGGGKGMTWGVYTHDATTGTDQVGCSAGGVACNAYFGDTLCVNRLPILCIANDGAPDPGVSVTSFYYEWSEAHIVPSRPMYGYLLTSLAVGDAVCSAQFGANYRMLEHHDGDPSGNGNAGWGLWAHGFVRQDTRFWVSIDGQAANCWD